MSRVEESFEKFLFDNSRKVCEEAIEKMKVLHDYFSDTDYIIATGGTYAAWQKIFDSKFSQMEGLNIVPANINDVRCPMYFQMFEGITSSFLIV